MKIHAVTCQCDECIRNRVRAMVAARDLEKASKPYLERRGGEPKRGDLQEALRERGKR